MLTSYNFKNLTLPTIIFFISFGGQGFRYSLGWLGYGLLTGGVILLSIYVYRDKLRSDVQKAPLFLVLFIIWCGMSLLWSQYPAETALGFTIQILTAAVGFLLARTLSWTSLVISLALSFQLLISISLVMEIIVGISGLKPLYPFVDATPGYPWVEGNLFKSGPLQGFMGNRNLLGFVAVLSLVFTTLDYYANKRSRLHTYSSVGLALLTIFLTRSATITVALAAVAIVLGLLYWMRRLLRAHHKYLYYGAGSGLLLLSLVAVLFSSTIFSLVGRDDDLTGRSTIWLNVYHLWQQHPAEGWGWMSYWAPWIYPFKDLAILNGTQYLQAHNAIIDIIFQTGLIGGVIALIAAVVISVRSWRIAVASPTPIQAVNLLPVLVISLLLIQSLTESRLLIEGNWLLFVLIGAKVKWSAPEYGSGKKALEKLKFSNPEKLKL